MISPVYCDDTTSGIITGFSLHSADSELLNGEYYLNDIYLCYTDLNELTDVFADNYGSYTPTNVISTPTLDLDWTNYEWQQEMVLDTPWYYDGQSNFILEFTYEGNNASEEPGNDARCWEPSENLVLDANDKYAEAGGLRPYSNWVRFSIEPDQGIESTSLGYLKTIFR